MGSVEELTAAVEAGWVEKVKVWKAGVVVCGWDAGMCGGRRCWLVFV